VGWGKLPVLIKPQQQAHHTPADGKAQESIHVGSATPRKAAESRHSPTAFLPGKEGISLRPWTGARNPFHLIVEVGIHPYAAAPAAVESASPLNLQPTSSSGSFSSNTIAGFSPRLLLSTFK